MSFIDYKNKFSNSDPSYSEYIRLKGLKKINQYGIGIKLKYPDSSDIQKFKISYHYWSQGDSYYKLAESFYGNSDYWWIIAFYNQTPMEQDLETGQQIEIPLPLELVIESMRK